MNHDSREFTRLEERSHQLFHDSVDGLDMRVRSRLTQARHAALDAAGARGRAPRWVRMRGFLPAAGVTAAAVLGIGLWLGLSGTHRLLGDGQPSLEDFDMVASTEEGSGDALEMLQNDLDFYDFADKASPEPAA